jgi:hypothetical protein
VQRRDEEKPGAAGAGFAANFIESGGAVGTRGSAATALVVRCGAARRDSAALPAEILRRMSSSGDRQDSMNRVASAGFASRGHPIAEGERVSCPIVYDGPMMRAAWFAMVAIAIAFSSSAAWAGGTPCVEVEGCAKRCNPDEPSACMTVRDELDRRCRAKEPQACVALARIYEVGAFRHLKVAQESCAIR